MYLDYWQLATKPFEPRPTDESFYYACESHEGALHKLRYAIQEGRGAAALAGPSGVGKTLLVERLAEDLDPESTPVVRLVFPQMSGRELLAYLADRLHAPHAENATGSIEESVRRLEELSERNAIEGRRPLVVIDEAHLLEDNGSFETIRLLTNFGVAGSPAFTLLLVGQMGLLSSVARCPSLDERLSVKTLLRTFTANETASYVSGRLAAAGATRDLFDDESLGRVHALTEGSARRINRLCDLALVVGFAAGAAKISADELDSVHRELVTVGSDRTV